MDKREFMRLTPLWRGIKLRQAAKAVDGALNLAGRQTIDALMQAAYEGVGIVDQDWDKLTAREMAMFTGALPSEL